MVQCLPCAVGNHYECWELYYRDGGCCCGDTDTKPMASVRNINEPLRNAAKVDGVVTDLRSTGRKRAALLIPDMSGMTCEWSGLKYAGGGMIPIIGCREKEATNRHHGPDKNTLNNERIANLHAICAQCFTGDMRILTDTLRWVRADEIQVGQKIIGFSEDISYTKGKFEESTVESIKIVVEPSYELYMEDGTILKSSHAHRWVGSRPNDLHAKWLTTEKMTKKRSSANYTIKKMVDVIEQDKSWESGWLAGFLDGEGNLNGYNLAVGQTYKGYNEVSNHMMHTIMEMYVPNFGYTHRDSSGNKNAAEILRVSNLRDVTELLMKIRPGRLVAAYPKWLYTPGNGRNKPKYPISASKRVEVVGWKFIGNQEVYSIQTSSKTLIVEGFLSHNCHNRWHSLNDKFYSKERPTGDEFYIPLSEYFPHDPDTLASVDDLQKSDVAWQAGVQVSFLSDHLKSHPLKRIASPAERTNYEYSE